MKFSQKIGWFIMLVLTFMTAMTMPSHASAQGPSLEHKAQRAFYERDWGSAKAFYTFLLNANEKDSVFVAREIIASYADGDSIRAIQALQKGMEDGLSLDLILSQVQNQSFEVGESDVYVNFMLTAIRHCPWISRAIEARILPYYEFRRNGPEIIRYSTKMLSGVPESPRYLLSLADGYCLTGDLASAFETWKEVLNIDPGNYSALLESANYLYNKGDYKESYGYFIRAFEIKPTPFVERRLEEIKKIKKSRIL